MQRKPANKQPLHAAIASGQTLQEAAYKRASWSTFSESLRAAQLIHDDVAANQEQLDAAQARLVAAQQQLQPKPTQNTSVLDAAMERASQQRQAEHYTDDSWQALQQAVAAAQRVRQDDELPQEHLDTAAQNLTQALERLQRKLANKGALTQALASARSLTARSYTPQTWQAFVDALNQAQQVADNEHATQQQVDQATAAVTAAQHRLQPKPAADKTELTRTIQEAQAIRNGARYTETTWQTVQQALQQAITVQNDQEADFEAVADAQRQLAAALQQLALRPLNMAALRDAIAQADRKAASDYTPDSWAQLSAALTAARNMLQSETAEQQQVDAAQAQLTLALSRLVVQLHKDVLNTQLQRAAELHSQATQYTVGSWHNLQSKVAAAQKLATDETATQDAINAAAEQLKQAIEQLVAKKRAPQLTVTHIETDELAKQATLTYQKNDPDQAYVSGEVSVYNQGQLVRTVPLEQLRALISELAYHTPYQLRTTITYYDGDTNQQITQVAPQTLQLELKRLTFRDVKKVGLFRHQNGRLVQQMTLSSQPQELQNFVVKLSTPEVNDVLLPVSDITAALHHNQPAYRVTVQLPELVHFDEAQQRYVSDYIFYIPQTPTDTHSITSFAELLEAIKHNPKGTFTLGADLTADEVALPLGQQAYVTTAFNGKLLGAQHTIYNLRASLFERLHNATVEQLKLDDVAIQSGAHTVGALARTTEGGKVSNVAVRGTVTATGNVGGVVGKATNTQFTQLGFDGVLNVQNQGRDASLSGGLIGEMQRGHLNKGYVSAVISGQATQNTQKIGGAVGSVTNGTLENLYTTGTLYNSEAKGQIGGLVGSTWQNGVLRQAITGMKVTNGMLGHGDVKYQQARLSDVVAIERVAKGTEEQWTQWITEEAAQQRLATMGISMPFEQTQPQRPVPSSVAYRNAAKLVPFYNHEAVELVARQIPNDHPLAQTDIVSLVPMVGDRVAVAVQRDNHLMTQLLIHFANETVAYVPITYRGEFRQSGIAEYVLTGTDIVYTPDQFLNQTEAIVQAVLPELQTVGYRASDMPHLHAFVTTADIATKRQQLGGNATEQQARDALVAEIMQRWRLEESFAQVKSSLAEQLRGVLTHGYVHAGNAAATDYLTTYIRNNKAQLLLGLAYVNRWYQLDFGRTNIQEITRYKPDFFGKEGNSLEWLVAIGSQVHGMASAKTSDLYRQVFAPHTGQAHLGTFLSTHRRLFAPKMTDNDWFKATTKAYIVEAPSEELPHQDVTIFNRLLGDQAQVSYAALPLLNLSDKSVFVMNNMTSVSFGMYDRYFDTSLAKTNRARFEAEVAKVNERVDWAAKRQATYFDTWYRLLRPESKAQLAVEFPVWNGYMNHRNQWLTAEDARSTAMKEFFAPIERHYKYSANTGAYATGSAVFYVEDDPLSQYGLSVFTHEMVHNHDSKVLFDGHGRREAQGPESFALGLLQSPRTEDFNVLGLNLIFEFNKNNSLHNASPQRFQTVNDLQQYMSGLFDVLYTLDYAEGMTVIRRGKESQKKAFNIVENRYDGNHAVNNIREITTNEWNRMNLQSINDLIDHELVVKRYYKTRTVGRNDYETVSLTEPIYGTGTNTRGASGGLTFRRNAFELLAAKGYYEGFVPFVSNQYKATSVAEGQAHLTDDYIINKIFDGRYADLKTFRKAMFQERIAKVGQLKPVTIRYQNRDHRITSYADIERLMQEAVAADESNSGFWSLFAASRVQQLKQALIRAYMQQTEEFKQSIYTES